MGVFTKILDKEKKIIEELYQIKILDIKSVSSGILNSNFQIDCGNIKYILRIFEADRTLNEEEQELILLSKIASFIPVSEAIKNKNNEYISVFENKKFALFNYVEGKVIEKIDTHIIREIATYLGKLHAFTKNISYEKYNRKTRLDFNYFYDKISQSDIDFQDKEKLLNLASEVKDYDFSYLASGIIHGDIFPDNVLFDENNNIKAILDFNESYYAPFIFDIAIVINFWIKITKYDFFTENNFIRDFFNYYSKYRKITNQELKVLDLACKKMLLTFIFLRLYREKIENSYQKAFAIEEKSYVSLLELI
ncbi:MAG: homoserine kinase [Fusobacterium sp.]|uniref:homoserine kinase n=1 Tax=Fusobacterium sp. TaxID=68766 RepID=UPI003FA16E81